MSNLKDLILNELDIFEDSIKRIERMRKTHEKLIKIKSDDESEEEKALTQTLIDQSAGMIRNEAIRREAAVKEIFHLVNIEL